MITTDPVWARFTTRRGLARTPAVPTATGSTDGSSARGTIGAAALGGAGGLGGTTAGGVGGLGGTTAGGVGGAGGAGGTGSMCEGVSGWIFGWIFGGSVQLDSIFQVQIHPCIAVSTGVVVSGSAVPLQLQVQFQTHVVGSAVPPGA